MKRLRFNSWRVARSYPLPVLWSLGITAKRRWLTLRWLFVDLTLQFPSPKILVGPEFPLNHLVDEYEREVGDGAAKKFYEWV